MGKVKANIWISKYDTVDRRNYPEERGPPPAPPLPPPPQPPPRVEKKPEIKNIDDILKLPGRSSRPERVHVTNLLYLLLIKVQNTCKLTGWKIKVRIWCCTVYKCSFWWHLCTDCYHYERTSREWKKPRCKAHTCEWNHISSSIYWCNVKNNALYIWLNGCWWLSVTF